MKPGSVVRIKSSTKIAPYKWGMIAILERLLLDKDRVLWGAWIRRLVYYDGRFRGHHIREIYKLEHLEEVQ